MLDQLKKDAKTLYARGHINQDQCVTVLGLRDPLGPVLKVAVKLTAWAFRKLVVHTEPKE